MKLGEMLVRDGRLTEEQVRQALARQARDGGRLGTVMVEMGLLPLDILTVYLGLELGIPIATRATLERVKRTAVRLLTPEQALHMRCVPIMVQDRQLLAAVEDPHDFEVLDQLSQITGYRVIPRVAPEIRIFYYLHRYYGVPMPERFAAVASQAEMPATVEDNLPAPPLPGLPPRIKGAASPMPVPVMPMAIGDEDSQPLNAEEEALWNEADQLVTTLESDEDASAEEAPQSTPDPVELEKAATSQFEIPEFYEPIEFDAAIEAMSTATQRGDVAHAIMSYAAGLFDMTALCIVRDNMAFGWKAWGPTLDRERIEALLIPLEASSIFQMATHQEDLFFHGALFPSTLHAYLYRVLRCQAPAQATVAGISIGKRLVNLLYGHQLDRGEVSPADLDNLKQACKAAAAAYVRLIAEAKQEPSG